MSVIIGLLLTLFVIIALLLVLLILVQDDGTEGAGIIFGSAASQQYGARKGNVVTKTTSILAALFIVIAFSLSFVFQNTTQDFELTNVSSSSTDDTKIDWWSTTQGKDEVIPLEIPLENTDIEVAPSSSPSEISNKTNTKSLDTSESDATTNDAINDTQVQ